jgi:hypothetical protein
LVEGLRLVVGHARAAGAALPPLDRALARLVGVSEGELRRLVRVSYAKVAEFQRRGAVHFHAVLRLDTATECRCPACLAPPPEPFTAGLLELALRETVAAVRVPCPPLSNDPAEPVRFARWGEQLDVRNITTGDGQVCWRSRRAGGCRCPRSSARKCAS